MFLPDYWLQFHNNNMLVSKTTTVLKQDRPSASIDTSNIPLVVYFNSDFDNRRAGLYLIKLTDWTLLYNGGLTMERRICSSGCDFGCIISNHILQHIVIFGLVTPML